MFHAQGSKIYHVHVSGEKMIAAKAASKEDAAKAARFLNTSLRQQRANHATDSARSMRRATEVNGFEWLGGFAEVD